MKKGLLWLSGLLLVIFSCTIPYPSLYAADFRSTGSSPGNITLDASVETRNLFIAGNDLIIEAKEIKKDLFAFGSNIQLNTRVEQGSFIAGKTINIRGVYGGNLFIAGSEVTIDAEVMGDVFLFCNKWTIKQGAIIHGDVYIGSGTGYHDGSIKGSLIGGGNEFYINGKVEQTANLTIVKSLTIGEKANINLLEYNAPQEATVLKGAMIQKTNYKATETNETTSPKPFRFPLVNYLSSLLFALILVFWTRKPIRHVLHTMQQQLFASLGIGFAVLICIPIAIFIVFLSLIGYKIAIALILFYALCILCLNPIAGIWLGELIFRLFKRPAPSPSWLGAIIGITVMQFIGWIPYFGWILLSFLSILSFGGLIITVFSHLKGINEI